MIIDVNDIYKMYVILPAHMTLYKYITHMRDTTTITKSVWIL